VIIFEYTEFAWLTGLVMITLSTLITFCFSSELGFKPNKYIWGYLLGSVVIYLTFRGFGVLEYSKYIYYFAGGAISGIALGYVGIEIQDKK